MKHLLVFLIFGVLVLAGCNDDETDVDFDPDVMHYDGFNASAPFFPAGTKVAAARFTTDITRLYEGKSIEAIRYYVYGIPSSCQLVIYGDGQGDSPGTVLYQGDITGDLIQNSWNTIPLPQPFAIDGSEIWIALRMEIVTPGQVIGCDEGPAVEGGDWLFESSDNQWLTYRTRDGTSINWNIRAMMGE